MITAVSLVSVATKISSVAQTAASHRLRLSPMMRVNGVTAARSSRICSSSGLERVYVFSTSGPASTRIRPVAAA